MLRELDSLVKDSTPIFTILAPLVTALAAYIAIKIKAQRSRKRRRKPQVRQINKKL